MKYLLVSAVMLLAGCSQATPPQSSALEKPPAVGMANPAAVYCQQLKGSEIPIQSPQGVRTQCKLPSGEIVDQWELYHRDHPKP